MINQEFKITHRTEEFRIGKVSPIELLAFGKSEINEKRDEMAQQIALSEFALEHLEVKVGDKWLPVKMKGREVWWPQGIENDLIALAELDAKFQEIALAPFFQKSSE